MIVDDQIRNQIDSFVKDVRNLLEKDISEQLEGVYGLHKDGTLEDLRSLPQIKDNPKAQLAREGFVYFINNEVSQKQDKQEAIRHLVLSLSFTHLNRLIALKLMERRKVIPETISRGTNSNGFKLFLGDFPEQDSLKNSGKIEEAYKNYLLYQYRNISEEIHSLFDPDDISNLIFPKSKTLFEVLDLINQESLNDIWTEDETIGWIYQYFTPKDRRKTMRKDNPIPKNSHELAVRNQFYTPRYVVQFLTDNTLGRFWYEMRKGDTQLIQFCEFMVRRPKEIFLGEGQLPPSQLQELIEDDPEKILNEPYYIPFRAKKDPREIRVLDPAAGSGHFLLYSFDILSIIYEEAYADPDLGAMLKKEHPEPNEFKKAIPALILRHNLHGVDIDPRAVQIASLALWLRAQRTYHDLGLKRTERPKITKSNIVCAEPMPGDLKMLGEFKDQVKPVVLGNLVDEVWQKMQLAGEAGSLLKIEQEISQSVEDAKEAWLTRPKEVQQDLFGQRKLSEQYRFDFRGIKEEIFWDEAEERLLKSLHDYAKRASNGHKYSRTLFAEDAAQGFAFIDLMRKKYDVVLMNPPFGESTTNSKKYIDSKYKNAKSDLFACSIDRGLGLLNDKGKIGAITNRTGFFIVTLEDWRKTTLLEDNLLEILVDLGSNVLDAALVETAAYIIEKSPPCQNNSSFIRLSNVENKDSVLLNIIKDFKLGKSNGKNVIIQNLAVFKKIPSYRIAFWMPNSFIKIFNDYPKFSDIGGIVSVGLQTSDNFRYIRLAWEPINKSIVYYGKTNQNQKTWHYYAKGGEYSPYYGDIHLLVNWKNNGYEIKNFRDDKGNVISYPRNEQYYFKPGLTYSERTTSLFSPRILNQGCLFDTVGPLIHRNLESNLLLSELGLFFSRIVAYCIEFYVSSAENAARHYTPRIISELPFKKISKENALFFEKLTFEIYSLKRSKDTFIETSRFFIKPLLEFSKADSLTDAALKQLSLFENNYLKIIYNNYLLENKSYEIYQLDQDSIRLIEEEFGINPCSLKEYKNIDEKLFAELYIDEYLFLKIINENSIKNKMLEKKAFIESEHYELLSIYFGVSPKIIVETRRKLNLISQIFVEDLIRSIISYFIGIIIGRWDVRYATGENQPPPLPDPFAPLPSCSPGMLQADDGLPTTESPQVYPLNIQWNGILIEDQGHPHDIVHKIREVINVIYNERAEAIEAEACSLLGISSFREYFKRAASKGFFDDHIKKYSKSRRKAPIYWKLSSSNGNYSIWLYYHRITRDTLFIVLNEYVNPKIELENSKYQELKQKIERDKDTLSRSQLTKLEKEIESKADLINELKDFKDNIEKIAKQGYDPDFDDGVILNMAPLHEVIPWKEPKAYWDDLEKGKYDWAHIAMKYWPERVKEKCKKDKSLAIAHGLEHLYEAD